MRVDSDTMVVSGPHEEGGNAVDHEEVRGVFNVIVCIPNLWRSTI